MFWASLLTTAAGLALIWTFMSQSWTNISAYISAETKNIQAYQSQAKLDQNLSELLLS